MLPGIMPYFGDTARVVPNAVTYRAGTVNFVVPEYNTLDMALWGGGASGNSATLGTGVYLGQSGSDTTISALSLAAGGGKAPVSTATAAAGGVGGTASGGTTNEPGSAGGGGNTAAAPNTGAGGAAGGAASGGGASVARGSEATVAGRPGADFGGGGASATWQSTNWSGGGGGGGFVRKLFTAGAVGAPVPGTTLSIVVGAGGPVSAAGATKGGKGADGAAVIRWS